jgi:hypothetical protein
LGSGDSGIPGDEGKRGEFGGDDMLKEEDSRMQKEG